MENLATIVAGELRRRGNESVKSLFWNADRGDLAVFARSHTPEVPKSFNLTTDPDMSVEGIADIVEERCAALDSNA